MGIAVLHEMTDREQTQAFSDDLNALIERYCQEFELTYAQAVGVMQIKIMTI